jgi:hypothetical protein
MLDFLKTYHKEIIIGTVITVTICTCIYVIYPKNSTIYVDDISTQTDNHTAIKINMYTQTDTHIPVLTNNGTQCNFDLDVNLQYKQLIQSTLINYQNYAKQVDSMLASNDPTFVLLNLVDLHEKLEASGLVLASKIAIKAIVL